MEVLVIAPHADDEVLGVGGTIARHTLVQNQQVGVLVVTDGASSQYGGSLAAIRRRRQEAERAASVLGVKQIRHLNFPDMRLDGVAHVELNQAIEGVVEEYRPTIVYTPYPDVNRDHALVFDSVMVATRPRPGQSVRAVYAYPISSSLEWTPHCSTAPFVANRYVEIGETMIVKVMAMCCYETELREYPHPRSMRSIICHALVAGGEVGLRFAERLCTVREVDRSGIPSGRRCNSVVVSDRQRPRGWRAEDVGSVTRCLEQGDLKEIGELLEAILARSLNSDFSRDDAGSGLEEVP